MASISEAQYELIKSLAPGDIPAKFRCAICSKMAVNAFRLPCCEQAICEGCQSTLPTSCPVCEHSPLSAADCSTHKSLRTTIRVFLRTEEKKREAIRPREVALVLPVEPAPSKETAEPVRATELPESAEPAAPSELATASAPHTMEVTPADGTAEKPLADREAEANASSDDEDEIEIWTGDATDPARQPPLANDETSQGTHTAGMDTTLSGGSMQMNGPIGISSGKPMGSVGGLWFDNSNGGFSNTSLGAGNFEQMQMMMALQSGMGPNAFSNLPMMGMLGMNMDPMTQMMMSGGIGMGMNGMNMNAGMGGFGGDTNNNWNEQQAWNNGQNNFNHPSASGMGNGDFGTFNQGIQTGYNQGNFGHPNQFNDFGQNNFGGFRGRGRGRGFRGGYGHGYGRSGFQQGGWLQQARQQQHNGYGVNDGFQNHNFTGQQQFPTDMNDFAQANQVGQAKGDGQIGEFGRQLSEAAAADRAEASDKAQEGGDADRDLGLQAMPGDPLRGANISVLSAEDKKDTLGMSIPTLDGTHAEAKPAVSGNELNQINGAPVPQGPPDVPINAPKGPKAMMAGLPNISSKHLQARGWVQPVKSTTSPIGLNGSSGKEHGGDDDYVQSRSSSHGRADRRGSDYPRERSREREKDRDRHDRDKNGGNSRVQGNRRDRRDRSCTRSSSRSRSQDRKESRRRRRHGGDKASGEEEEVDDRRRRRHRRKQSAYIDEHDIKLRNLDERHVDPDHDRGRSPSTTSGGPRKYKHRRSRKDRDGERHREKDREREEDHERRHNSIHRTHRDSERRDRDREKEKDRRERKDRNRERDKDRHRNKRPTPGPDSLEKRPDMGAELKSFKSRGMEIKGASAKSHEPRQQTEAGRRSSHGGSGRQSLSAAAPDPHAAEREARNRERLLKETRRMATMAFAGIKRGRGGDDTGGDESRSRNRRKGRRGEIVSLGDDENRMRRLEEERERARYD